MHSDQKGNPRWKRIWIFATLIEIGNEYVTEGDARYFKRMAPFWDWIHAFKKTLGLSIICTIIVYLATYDFIVKSAVEVHPYDLALSILPNLLGFVTGVYALIFGISGKFLREIQEHNNAKATSSKKMNPTILGLNSSFAFPLLIMVVTIFVATFQKIIQTSESLKYLTWLLFFFSLTLTYQLIKTLFRLGRSVLLEKFGNEDA
jgi:hypothetical protein